MKIHSIGGLSDTYERLDDAVISPLDADDRCGVLRQDGSFCEFSRGIKGPRRGTDVPLPVTGDIPHLAGRHLFGGWIRPHFGHFLLESTPRLWAFDELSDSIDSVVYIPFRGGARKARDRYKPFLDIFSGGKPINIVAKPVRVEHLIVPDPGFGHGPRITGSPRYRDFSRAQVKSAVTPNGSERLYISRTQLWDKRGGVFGEEQIESLLEAEGYSIFYPELFTAKEQLARYSAAREIVCLDGSALHMAAYAIQSGTRIGMIFRRRAGLLAGLVRQLETFADAKVTCFDALRNSWVDEDARRVDFRSIGELDLPKLQAQLYEAGFIGRRPTVPDLTTAEINVLIANMKRGPMRPVALDPVAQ
ncbi:glycosyltransferase family 61 protein [Parasedimentitalea psychrophila]|uniref:Glycosyltransferase 61 family protein n=1 Tax=Parasedimentitalea psychrophila TaxID=2997337 RepID=A0A9Y2L1M4_9RHOB|nr:glycosyltransferase 61 family protein [Parasedimentitalea psychrophila]WIY26305.1 glycosyltransferase 61 family protein [Parasedimentitalea psychrophila]